MTDDLLEIKRCVIYTRVSHEEQVKGGDSLETQLYVTRIYAREHGYKIVREYEDPGVSAYKYWKNRPALMQLLEELPETKPDIILITRMDRWTRQMEWFYDIYKRLRPHHTEIECVKEDLQTGGKEGSLKMHMYLTMAQSESEKISERIKDVFEHKKQGGYITSGAIPWGYLKEDKEHNKRLIKDPELEEIVPVMFETFLKYRKIVEVRRKMEELGHRWSTETWRARLTNEKYSGEFEGVKDYCPAYVSREDWEKVQEILDGNSIKSSSSGKVYLFTSLIECPCCHHNMVAAGTAHKNTCYYYYRCYHHYKIGCPMKARPREDRVEEWLLANLEKQFKLDKKVQLKKAKPKPKPRGSKKIDYEGQLRRLNKQYREGLILDEEEYFTEAAELKKKIEEQKKEEPVVIPERVNSMGNKVLGFRKAYAEMTPEAKCIFWHRILKRIYVDEEGNVTHVDFAY